MGRRRNPQEYSAEQFDRIVAQIQGDPEVRKDIEAITGQKIEGKSPRELFDLFLAIDGVTEVQAVVVRYGQARRALRQTRVDMELDPAANMPEATAQYVARLQAKVDEERAMRARAEAALKVAQSRNVLSLPAANITRKAVNG